MLKGQWRYEKKPLEKWYRQTNVIEKKATIAVLISDKREFGYM